MLYWLDRLAKSDLASQDNDKRVVLGVFVIIKTYQLFVLYRFISFAFLIDELFLIFYA